jgi:hypothetical protein
MSQIERIEGKIRIICAQKNARWEPCDTRGVDVLSTVFPASRFAGTIVLARDYSPAIAGLGEWATALKTPINRHDLISLPR